MTRTSNRTRKTVLPSSRPSLSATKRESSLTPPPPDSEPEIRTPARKVRKIKHESDPDTLVKAESDGDDLVKMETNGNGNGNDAGTSGSTKSSPTTTLKDRKLKMHTANSTESPFPSFPHPTPLECSTAYSILSSIHGAKIRPAQVVASKTRAGCGDSPSVLDALVRTILSQNTSDANSTRAKLSMDKVYGGSDSWEEIVSGGQEKLQEAIKCGGLSAVKSKVILKILDQAKKKYGEYTLDHLHKSSTEDAMEELLSFDGVGPKTASCVLLFCLQREDFAVDTHVHRITGMIGWRPKNANREQTYHHLNKKIPDEYKYGLHILFVQHGKVCDECKASGAGKNSGKCELRKAFRNGGIKDEGVKLEKIDDNEVKEEDVKNTLAVAENIKQE